MEKILEICVDSLGSARAAIRGGADRLELCSALAVGGLTPYEALLRQIRAESDIPVRCLMRPRAGDFLYTPEEIDLMALLLCLLGWLLAPQTLCSPSTTLGSFFLPNDSYFLN